MNEIKEGDIVTLKSDDKEYIRMTVGVDDGYEKSNMICYYVSTDPLERIKKVIIHKSALKLIS